MKLDFDNIFENRISIDDFQLNWRFKDEKHDRLPDLHLEQLLPLDKDASEYLWNYIVNAELHSEFPFKKTFFSTVVHKTIVLNDNNKEVKTWLYERGLPLDKYVFLSWQKTIAMIVPWKLLIKYFNSFYYGISDDLTIIDQSLTWALLFYHSDQIYFGATDNYKPSKNFENINLLL